MTERPLDACDFKGVGHFEAKFRLKSYVLRQYGRLDGEWLQLCRWKFSHEETLRQSLIDYS